MKILHIVPGLRSGGVAQVVYDLAKSQIEKGWEVSILSIHNKDYNDNPGRFNQIGVDVQPMYTNQRFDFRIILKLRRLFKDQNVIHVHLFPNQLYSAIAYRMLPKRNKPILLTTEHNTYNNRRKYSILKYLDRWMYKTYSSIVAISPETSYKLNEWLNNKLIKSRIKTIYNGVEIKKFNNSKNDKLRTELNIPSTHKIVTMVARMSHPKDPVTLVKAASHIENLDVVFVGDGPLNQKIESIAKELNILNRVHIMGLRKDVPELLLGSDIGCLSTEWDGFGLVAVEYMAAGLPVLVTDVPGLREVVGNKDCLFPFKREDILVEKIRYLIENTSYYKYQQAYSLQRCNNYDVMNMTNEYHRLYLQLNN